MNTIRPEDIVGELALLSSGEMIYGDLPATKHALYPKLLTIGSDPAKADLWFQVSDYKHTCISPIHCIIFYDHASETCMIKDSFSDYGTFLNGDQLNPQQAVSLKNQDVIELGSPLEGGALLRFYLAEREDETARISNILPTTYS